MSYIQEAILLTSSRSCFTFLSGEKSNSDCFKTRLFTVKLRLFRDVDAPASLAATFRSLICLDDGDAPSVVVCSKFNRRALALMFSVFGLTATVERFCSRNGEAWITSESGSVLAGNGSGGGGIIVVARCNVDIDFTFTDIAFLCRLSSFDRSRLLPGAVDVSNGVALMTSSSSGCRSSVSSCPTLETSWMAILKGSDWWEAFALCGGDSDLRPFGGDFVRSEWAASRRCWFSCSKIWMRRSACWSWSLSSARVENQMIGRLESKKHDGFLLTLIFVADVLHVRKDDVLLAIILWQSYVYFTTSIHDAWELRFASWIWCWACAVWAITCKRVIYGERINQRFSLPTAQGPSQNNNTPVQSSFT